MTSDGRIMTIRKFLTGVLTALSILFGSSHSAFAWGDPYAGSGEVDISDAGGTRLCQIGFLANGVTAFGSVTDSNLLTTTYIGGGFIGVPAGPILPVTVADIETCGFSNVTNFIQTLSGTNYANTTNIELTFQASHPLNATIVPKDGALPSFTGDGTSIHAYVFKLAGPAGGMPTLTVTRTLVSSASSSKTLISNFLKERGNLILNNQPSMIEFVDGTREDAGFNSFELGITAYQQAGRISLSKRQLDKKGDRILVPAPSSQAYNAQSTEPEVRTGKWDAWTEIKAARSDIGERDTKALLGFVGGHYFINENFIVGLMGQVDWAKQTDAAAGSTVKGTGWMLGPYVAGQVPEQDLYYEARAAWGTSSNRIIPSAGAAEDGFDTTRWLISGKVSGAYEYGEFTIRPTLFVSYLQERQLAYTDSNSATIDAQTVSLGELNLGPNVTRKFILENGMPLNAKLGVSAVYNFGAVGESSTSSFENGQLRARLTGELTTVMDNGTSLSFNGYYDGVGQSDFSAYGVGLKLTVPIQ